MNYYPRYLGDYQRKTGHLSLTEHGVYAVLLDHYYGLRKPLPADLDRIYRICRAITPAEQRAVDTVVAEFFPVAADGLHHNARCDEEITKWEAMAERNREVGKSGGRPKKKPTENPDGNHGGSVSGQSENPQETQLGTGLVPKEGVLETHEKPSPTPTPTPEFKSQHQNQSERDARAPTNGRTEANLGATEGNGQVGVKHFGTALCEIGSPAMAEAAERWREEPGIHHAAMESWLEHRRTLGKPLKPSESLQLAKVLARHGDADAQTRLVQLTIGNGWHNLRFTERAASSNGAGRKGERIEDTIARLNREADEAGEPRL